MQSFARSSWILLLTLAACDGDPQAQLCDAVCKIGEDSLSLGASACDLASAEVRLSCIKGSDDCPLLVAAACGAPETCAMAASGSAVCCTNECQPGEKACLLGGVGTCGNYDDDPCTELGDFAPCAAEQACLGGACCTHECLEGASRCTTDGKEQRCGYFDADACRDWGAATSCGGTMACRGASCCADDCSTDAVECAGDDARRVCGHFDADACLDWKATLCLGGGECHGGACCLDTCQADVCDSSTEKRACVTGASGCSTFSAARVACGAGETCHAGSCCTVDCQVGTTRCSPDGSGMQQCGNHDADPCPEWSPTQLCVGPQVCRSDSANFPPAQCCTDECTDKAVGSCSGALIRACGNFDGDPCLELSPVAVSCAQGGACTGGVCNRCGDGIARGGEACDDGDTDDNDGCDRLCHVQAICPAGAAATARDTASGHCYAYFDLSIAWADALTDCAGRGGGLVSIGTGAENDLLAAMGASLTSDGAAYIGLSDAASEGAYTWSDGTAFAYTNWAQTGLWNEPNDAASLQNCGVFFLPGVDPLAPTGTWADFGCAPDAGMPQGFLCEFSPTQ